MPTLARTTDDAPETWPAGITARILTSAAILTRDRNATVDIHDDPNGRSTATCQPCGWTFDHGHEYRPKVLEQAQQHADRCTALAHPATA